MMNAQRSMAFAETLPTAQRADTVRRVDAALATKAMRMHRLSRARAETLVAPLLADHAMDVMLTLVIAQAQGLVTTVQAVLQANAIDATGGEELLRGLMRAGLASISEDANEIRRTVVLTPAGFGRMQGYISIYPDV